MRFAGLGGLRQGVGSVSRYRMVGKGGWQKYNRLMHDCLEGEAGELIGPSTTESYRILPGRANSGLVIVCDHANNAFPPGYGTLGLPADQLVRHIAYDIGAFEVTRRLSELLGAPAVVSHYSRLFIDLNRGLDDPTLVMRISDGAVVPGNRTLSDLEREKRVRDFYEPYHDAVGKVLDTAVSSGVVPVLLSVHSFTDVWRGVARPWHAGVLWDQDPRFAVPLLKGLQTFGDALVGDNEPYSGRLKGDSMWRHGTMRGVAHALIELRQDLIKDEPGQALWAERMAEIVAGLLNDPAFCSAAGSIEFHVSNADISDERT